MDTAFLPLLASFSKALHHLACCRQKHLTGCHHHDDDDDGDGMELH